MVIKKDDWYVYILKCKDNSLYTGTTNNVNKRMVLHSEGKGSKYVSSRGFKKLLFAKSFGNRSYACKCESYIKKLPKKDKLNFLIKLSSDKLN